MLKKIITVIASAALVVSGITPSFAASNADSQHRSWSYSVSEGNTPSTSKTWSFDVSPGATEVRAATQFKFGANLVAASVGQEIDASIVLRKPNGEVFENGATNPYFIHNNTYPNAPYTIANLAGGIESYLSYSTTWSGNLATNIPAGRWTAEVTVTLDGAPINLDASGATADSAYLFSKQAFVRGTNLIQNMPTTVSDFNYYSATCVNKDLVAPNDVLRFTSTLENDGTTTVDKAYVFEYRALMDDTFIQRQMDSSTGSWEDVVTWTEDLETKGMYVKANKYTTVKGSTSGSLDLGIYNTTTNTEVSTSCASAAPAAPTISISSLYGGEIFIPEIPGAPGYEYEIVSTLDESVVVAKGSITARYSQAVNGVFEGYFSGNYGSFQAGRTYKARLKIVNPVASSAWSSWSEASGLVGPSAPNAPTLEISSPTMARVNIPVVAGFNNSNDYKARLYNVADRTTRVAESTYCGVSGLDTSKMFCEINADGLEAPNQFVAVGLVKNSSGIYSAESADSNIVTGIASGVTLTNSPSGLTTDGKARLVGDNVLGALLNTSISKISTSPDGNGGLYIASRTSETQIDISKIKAGVTELDSTFGSNGKVSFTVNADETPRNTAGRVTWFGPGNAEKWIFSIPGGTGYKVAEGTASTLTSTLVSIDTRAFCQAEMGAQASDGPLKIFSAPTVRPVAVAYCLLYGASVERNLFLVKINTDGTMTKLSNLTPEAANDFYVEPAASMYGYDMLDLKTSINKSATGSQVALALVMVNSIRESSQNGPPSVTAHSRVLWRIPADLSAPTEQALDYTTNTNLSTMNQLTEPTLKLQPFNNGSKIYAMVLSGGSGCSFNPTTQVYSCAVAASYKLHQANLASGNFDAPGAAKNLVIQGSFRSLGFQEIASTSTTTVPTLDSGEMCMQSAPGQPVTCSFSLSPSILNLADGRFTKGEPISYTVGGPAVEFKWTNANGNLQWLFTKVSATGHSVIEWKPAVVSTTPVVPVVVPNIAGLDATASVDAGGGTVTITGTNLTLVTKIVFGAHEFSPTSKSATKITFKVPSKALAGGASVPVSVRFGSGAGTLMNTNRTFTYVGATKLAQSISIDVGADTYLPGAAPRQVMATSVSGGNPVPLPVTVVSKTTSICTYVQGQLSFVGNGKCIIEATQAGNAGYAAATKVTKEIWVTPDYDAASTLYSTDAGKPTVTLTGVGLTSVTSVELVNPADPTEKITVTGAANIKANATGTQLTVKLPAAGVLAGDTADIKLVWGPQTTTPILTGDTFEFVGPAKLNQVIDFPTVGLPATYGDEIRRLAPVSKDGSTVLDVVVSLKSVTPTVCSVTGYDVRFLANGLCKITASQAGNAGINKAADVTMQFQVSKKTQSISIADTTLETTDAAEAISAGAELDNEEMTLEYFSGNEDVCTVDGAGFITGLQATNGVDKLCVITIKQLGDNRYSAATDQTLEVTITTAADPADVADAEGDGNLNPAPIASAGAKTFTATNDAGFELSWDKATGKLIPRAKGVYTGFIQARLSFTKNGVTYTCQVVFGSNSVMKNKTSKEKKAAKALKTFTTKNAFCADPNEIKPALLNPVGGLTRGNFAKIKPSAKDSKAAVTVVGSKKYEANAFAQLKGFTGEVTIEIKRFRTWPTTGVNFTGDKSKTTGGKKIPVTTRTTRVILG